MGKLSPMMQQFFNIKENHKDSILLFRLGDFYEMFFEDAIIGSKILEITLTGRDCGLEKRAPMCGVPYHSVNNYIKKLIENDYKVAICEQVEDSSESKGIVKREVVRIITPGTVIDQEMLDEKSNNYLCSLYIGSNDFGISYVDVSTGELYISQYFSEQNYPNDLFNVIINELSKLSPSEIIVRTFNNDKIDLGKWNNKINIIENTLSLEDYNVILLNFFESVHLDDLNVKGKESAIYSLGILLNYLTKTQKKSLEHINKFNFYHISDYLQIDNNTRRNLELIETVQGKKGKGTLFWVLDNTTTSMGSRLLRKWIEKPLHNIDKINNRLDSIEELLNNILISNNIKEQMKKIYDVERLLSKIIYGNCNGRDLTALKHSIYVIPEIKDNISTCNSSILKNAYKEIDCLEDIYDLLNKSIIEDSPVSLKDGGIIKSGFNTELDELREITMNSKNWISNLQTSERERTGIKNLKIGYNKVFGYYLEVSKSNIKYVPDNYQRKQTLSNSERFSTPELKEMEATILSAEDKMTKLEIDLFTKIRLFIKDNVKRIQGTAHIISNIDVLNGLSITALKNNYIRPTINNEGFIEIIDGRHPVIEKIFDTNMFVPNDTYIDNKESRVSIITGPNMAGKSTYMRQVALIALLSHIGCYVPAREANISLLDQIFTRVGASDDLSEGKSTFMVEMSEVSNILANATNNSLLILDEIGRGTSTYDGLSIAWAVTEYITKHIKAKTLFATHYHELSELENKLDGIKNFKILIKESGDDIIFLRKITAGNIDKSYGIQVAKLAGLPKIVLDRAKSILYKLEESDLNKSAINEEKDTSYNELQISMFNTDDTYKKFIEKNILNIDINNITPLKAINVLNQLIENSKKI